MAADEYQIDFESALWPQCCIYKVPTSLWMVKKEAYTPLLISIGPIHHSDEKLEKMQEQKQRYSHFFWKRPGIKHDSVNYKAFLEKEEQNIRQCYQNNFSNISKKQFVDMILLDAVFIMELFLREAEKGEHKDDYIVTRPCVSKTIQRDLLLLQNQLPIYVLEELYDRVPKSVKKHTRFVELAHKYFASCYPHEESSKRKCDQEQWEKSLHFTDLIRCSYFNMEWRTNHTYSTEECLRRTATKLNEARVCMLRTATKLNEAGVSFEKVLDKPLLDIKFEKKPFFSWFLCLGCLPYSKCFKARFQFPQLKVDHTTECVLRNLIAFEQCHYPEEPYICNYVSLIDSLIHTKDDAELLVEKEAIVHELGSDKELATLVNSLCKHVVVTNLSCYHQIIKDLDAHYNNDWTRAMGTLKWVYFRDPWRGSSTLVGFAFVILTIFNFWRVIKLLF